ncbi:MAG TPA: response regulator transcription factor [Vicinamibacterales bacterium]|nr:response regulator transcription factor [Vicinamibacterales bacterium]
MTKILVVEDEPYIALGLKSDLALEGYEVEVASDGETAVDRARKEPFDLILLDVMLPGKDGFAVCRELRHDGVRTPIIMLTAKSQEAEKVLGLELGADDYVTKPFSPLELRARVQAVLRRVSGEAPEVYRFGDVEMDFTRAEVRRNGTVVLTSALEFKLLTVFIRHRGRLLTRDRLLDEVWGQDGGPTDRAIDNHIMNLRRKIEPRPDRPRFLVSVRGLGYRFDG